MLSIAIVAQTSIPVRFFTVCTMVSAGRTENLATSAAMMTATEQIKDLLAVPARCNVLIKLPMYLEIRHICVLLAIILHQAICARAHVEALVVVLP